MNTISINYLKKEMDIREKDGFIINREIIDDIIDSWCEDCGGTGYTTLPAHQQGGEIVDEEEVKCVCK